MIFQGVCMLDSRYVVLIFAFLLLAGCASQTVPEEALPVAPVEQPVVVDAVGPVPAENTTKVVKPFCGDGVCAGSENCDRCAKDCACKSPAECYQGACKVPECGSDNDCKDKDGCTIDTCEFSQHPNAFCSHKVIKEFRNNDGCCPRGADSDTDTDCVPVCGNNVCEMGENNEKCTRDCPASCGDGECEEGESPEKCPADC